MQISARLVRGGGIPTGLHQDAHLAIVIKPTLRVVSRSSNGGVVFGIMVGLACSLGDGGYGLHT